MSRRSLLFLTFLALDLKPVESLHVPNSTFKRTCPEGKRLFESVCCDECQPGTVVDHGCTETSLTRCKSCTEGKEYMDHPNLSRKCLKCSLCDTEHGLEVKENCTTKQNVKCVCKPGFFCSSEQCLHCDPCDKCEEDGIEEDCTQSKNTKCRSKDHSRLFFLFFLITSIPIVLLIWWYCSQKSKKGYTISQKPDDQEGMEMEECFPDIDLDPYIPEFANEMTKGEVLQLVRKLGLQRGSIDAIIQDHVHNTDEQKFALLRAWYELNGIKGARKKLIITLRQLRLCRMADTFEQKIKTVI